MKHVILAGGRSPVCLVLARAFYRLGWQVIIIEHLTLTLCRVSRAVSRYHKITAPVTDFDRFREDALAVMAQYRHALFIPVNEDILHYSRFQDEIRAAGIYFDVVAHPQLTALHHKIDNIQMAADAGLAVPETRRWQGEHIDFTRWVLKPIYSRFGNQLIDCKTQSPNHPPDCYVRQQRIRGVQICVYAQATEGGMKAYAAYKTNFGVSGGASLVFLPYKSQQVYDLTARFIRHHSLSGTICLDFLFDGQTYWFIECNPRMTHGAAMLTDGQLVTALSTTCTAKCLHGGLRTAMKAGWVYMLLTQPRRWWKTLRFVRHCRDMIWQPDDKKPFLMLPFLAVWLVIRAVLQRENVPDSLTRDIIFDERHDGRENEDPGRRSSDIH
ncbi:hypothetical protein L9H26_02385 [Morganella psychrotolerans]|uniref:ATP-grasp domain-containing protein n=1 Tax=Morganella psychrotolerans TaxID=368603 RepID=A0A5M9RBY5_9GAMM|nr:hypothetical protein [Morganella psychrotolerans]KAA8717757.1 hypothetical protein F4V73_07955 [Morganella psychrotolerans]OBU08005.1 hypothetical protein AYY16_01060 [Morganella psychrotolerans]